MIYTSFVHRTIIIDITFWSTSTIRISKVFRNTDTGSGSVSIAAFYIRIITFFIGTENTQIKSY